MTNREIQPSFFDITKLKHQKPKTFNLSNGIPAFSFFSENDKIIKLDLIFDAGIYFQPNTLIATTTNIMLREGTRNFSSIEISEKLDFYGAYLSLHTEKDKAVASLYCLHKYYNDVIKLFAEIIKYPIFPENELQVLTNKHKEQYKIDSEKVSVLAFRKLQQLIFTKSHKYGQLAESEDFDKITPLQLIKFHKKAYNSENCKLILSGFVDDEIHKITDQHFGKSDWAGSPNKITNSIEIQESSKTRFNITKENSVQSAIRIGKILFNINHPDYVGIKLLNTLLGGYFGSRLMSNIREDKGYTYGINSQMVSFQHAGFFTINTEVGSEYVEPTLIEIEKEINILQNNLVSTEELTRLKNYFTGNILRSFDGALSTADSFRTIIDYNLPFDYYEKYVQQILSIEPKQLLLLAKKHLNFDSLNIVVAGNNVQN